MGNHETADDLIRRFDERQRMKAERPEDPVDAAGAPGPFPIDALGRVVSRANVATEPEADPRYL